MAHKSFTFTKLYFTVISIVWIIGTVVGYGMALYQWLMLVFITDQEYIDGSYKSYEITQCEDPRFKARPVAEGETPPAKTPEEIKTCQEEAIVRVLNTRGYEAKNDIIGGVVRGTLFLFVFLTHYPRMIKRDSQGSDSVE